MSDIDKEIKNSGVEIVDIVKTFFFSTNMPDDLVNNLIIKTDKILDDIESKDYSGLLAGQIYDGKQIEIAKNLYCEDYISTLVESIESMSHAFVERFFSKIDKDKLVGMPPSFQCKINDMWIVSQEAHDYNPPHEHFTKSNVGLSGVFYLKIPEQINEKKVDGCFHFSWGPDINFDLLKFRYPDHKTIVPKPGMFLLFPKNTTHEVFPFRGDGERRCIAFNVNVFPSDGVMWA